MSEQSRYEYRIDAANTITHVSSAWEEFAQQNDAPELTAAAVYGRPILDFITGPVVRHLYQDLFDRVRQYHRHITVPFRCDGPDVRRFMRLDISPRDDNEINFDRGLST